MGPSKCLMKRRNSPGRRVRRLAERRLGLRPLTATERAFLRALFGPGLRVREVRVGALRWRRRAVSPWGSLALFPATCFIGHDGRQALDLSRARVRGVLAHEATHIW